MTRQLRPGGQEFRGDDGSAPPAVAAALAAYAAGEGSEHAVLVALAASRLLVPVVAIAGARPAPGQGEKDSEMALPTLIGQDGRPAIIAFTCLDALARWHADARPVPAGASRVWAAAVTESAAVVIDVAGPVPLAVEGARLAALARGEPVPLPHEDPDVAAAVVGSIGDEPAITGVRLLPPDGNADLRIDFRIAAGIASSDAQAAIQRAATRLSVSMARRIVRGVELAIS